MPCLINDYHKLLWGRDSIKVCTYEKLPAVESISWLKERMKSPEVRVFLGENIATVERQKT